MKQQRRSVTEHRNRINNAYPSSIGHSDCRKQVEKMCSVIIRLFIF